MSTALIPGSFDPITSGHLDVIRRASVIFERVVVAVMHNDMTKYAPNATIKQYLFSPAEREELVSLACADLPNVEVVTDDGLLIDLFERLSADVIVKGLRNEADYRYEQTHARWNREHDPRAETLYIPTDPVLAEVSSTRVRTELAAGRVPDGLLPPPVAARIRTIHGDHIRQAAQQ